MKMSYPEGVTECQEDLRKMGGVRNLGTEKSVTKPTEIGRNTNPT